MSPQIYSTNTVRSTSLHLQPQSNICSIKLYECISETSLYFVMCLIGTCGCIVQSNFSCRANFICWNHSCWPFIHKCITFFSPKMSISILSFAFLWLLTWKRNFTGTASSTSNMNCNYRIYLCTFTWEDESMTLFNFIIQYRDAHIGLHID